MPEQSSKELRSTLLEKTRKGRVQDWVERISVIAVSAGCRPEQISWQGSPETVAHHVCSYLEAYGHLDRLRRVLEESLETESTGQ